MRQPVRQDLLRTSNNSAPTNLQVVDTEEAAMVAAVTAAKVVLAPVVMASKAATGNPAAINNVLRVAAMAPRVRVVRVPAVVMDLRAKVDPVPVVALDLRVKADPVPAVALGDRVAVDVPAEGLVVPAVAHRKNCWSLKNS